VDLEILVTLIQENKQKKH